MPGSEPRAEPPRGQPASPRRRSRLDGAPRGTPTRRTRSRAAPGARRRRPAPRWPPGQQGGTDRRAFVARSSEQLRHWSSSLRRLLPRSIPKRRDRETERLSLRHAGKLDRERRGCATAENGCDEGHPAAHDLALSILRIRGDPEIHDIPRAVVGYLSPENDGRRLVGLTLKGDAKGLGGRKSHTDEHETHRHDDRDR